MNKKLIIIITIVLIGLAAASYAIFFSGSNGTSELTESEQLYTCGMHPEIISDEPGTCPICEMDLTPIKEGNSSNASSGERKILYWRAPMDPNEIYDEPGQSKMGMDLVPVYEDEGGASGVVTVDGALQQTMNVKTAEVEERNLSSTIVTNGVLTTDETKEYMVTTKVSGWVEDLFVNYTGQEVKRGEKLIEIYSPELVSAQQELLTASSYNEAIAGSGRDEISESGNRLLKNTRRKLELLDMSENEIENLLKSGETKTYVTLYAPFDGTVLSKNVMEGQKINAGANLLHIADLSELWLMADVYENELGKIQVGAKADVKFNAFPGDVYQGEVSFIYPTIDPKTRTAQVRIGIPNKDGKLKPSMFGSVEITGKEFGAQPVVDQTAVIRSGKNAIVIKALGGGKFKPTDVKLGQFANGYYQVLEGLKPGDKIVTSAQFLIDSESSLRASVQQFSSNAEKSSSNEKDANSGEPKEGMNMIGETDGDGHDENAHKDNARNPIIREGLIDLKSIDENSDGKVFQDFMDWNVISDEPGRCPICNMILQEVTLEEAKDNLLENGFQVK